MTELTIEDIYYDFLNNPNADHPGTSPVHGIPDLIKMFKICGINIPKRGKMSEPVYYALLKSKYNRSASTINIHGKSTLHKRGISRKLSIII